MQEQSTLLDRPSAQEKSSYTSAHAELCAESESVVRYWTADVGVCRWITFRQDGTGVVSHINVSWTPAPKLTVQSCLAAAN